MTTNKSTTARGRRSSGSMLALVVESFERGSASAADIDWDFDAPNVST